MTGAFVLGLCANYLLKLDSQRVNSIIDFSVLIRMFEICGLGEGCVRKLLARFIFRAQTLKLK